MMSIIRYTVVTAVFFISAIAQAFPIARVNGFETWIPPSFTPNYNFESIVKLSNCSGSLIRFETSLPTDKAMILSNGHCIQGGFPQPGTFAYGRAVNRRVTIYNASGGSYGSFVADTLVYATMTGTDVSLYRLTVTYEEIGAQYGFQPLLLASTHPEPQTAIEVISGYWMRGYSCAVDGFAFQLQEGGYSMNDSVRYSRPGCEVIGGTSGSPVVAAGTRTVIAVNNTVNESGQRCTMNNPCEVDAFGNVTFEKGIGYAQETYQIYTCLNANREIDLSIPGCQLFH